MNTTDAAEKWEVKVGEQIYEGTLEKLKQWIDEGALLKNDKVRRGNLRWIEAQKVPNLRNFFEALELSAASLPLASGEESIGNNTGIENSNAAKTITDDVSFEQNDQSLPRSKAIPNLQFQTHTVSSKQKIVQQENLICSLHAESAADYICKTCANCFCKSCPNSYGGSVKICPFCGAMCQPLAAFRENEKKTRQSQTAENEKFGAADLSRALTHPFKFGSSLFFGALMFAFFTVGQNAVALGGFVMIGAAFFCALGANMLTFGILANTVEKFSTGNLEANFMPDFEDFSLWDDVVHPFFLSVGAYLSAFAPFILVCIVGFYLIFNSMTTQATTVRQEIAKVPGTESFDRARADRQTQIVKQLTENLHSDNEKNLAPQSEIQTENFTVQNKEEEDFREIEQMIADSRRSEIESLAGQSAESESQDKDLMIRAFLGLAAPLVVVGFIALLWGAFYFPAACAVAGYTRSFIATINPFVGLDTIKRLGFDYLKILLMGLLIVTSSGFINIILNVILSPLEIPKMGNIPAKILSSVFTFYFSIVFASILGYALYKNSAKLKLPR